MSSKEIKEFLRKQAKKGNKAQLAKYGVEKRREWGKLGGRPKKSSKENKPKNSKHESKN